MVTTPALYTPVTPAGNPVTVAPVAPLTVYVMLVMDTFLQTDCALEPATELRTRFAAAVTFKVPVALTEEQLPVVVTVYVYVPGTVGEPKNKDDSTTVSEANPGR